MRFSHNLIKTSKSAREFDTLNATLLQKGGFIDQTMAGVYAFLPLGWRVLNNIENIIREEMNTIAAEVFLPAIVPKKLWQQTGRLDTVDVLFQASAANKGSQQRNDGTYILNSTHEEIITPIVQKYMVSYKDFPFAVYQIQTKFRNEERPKSGLLRGREFRMKDLYSFHLTDADREQYYDQVKEVYRRIFDRLGIGQDTYIALASGGDFTSDNSHEFQTKLEAGEDTIFYDEASGNYYNSEIAPAELKATAEPIRVSEVGNIFPLGTKFPDAFGYHVTGEAGKPQPVYMASYGIGSSRIMGVIVEKCNDERGIIWPASVAPFTAHLVVLGDDAAILKQAEGAYQTLQAAGITTLFDDRTSVSAGEKLANADLIGCPWRIIISRKTNGEVEVQPRAGGDPVVQSIESFIKTLV